MSEAGRDCVVAERWLTVHALSEFVFCPRAGLLTVETREDHTGELPSNLDFSLPYSVKELEQSLNRHLNWIWWLGGIALLLLIGAGIAFWSGRELFMLFAAGPLLFLIRPLGRRATAIQQLLQLRQYMLQCRPQELDLTQTSPVSWWELLADGWTSVPCHEAYRDEELGISGSPWRTVRRGSMTIPVFKMEQVDPAEEPRIFPQHVVRMAGYCHLIETCEVRESPAGILLFGDSYRGLAVPNSAEAKELLRSALRAAREVLVQASNDGPDPPPAPAGHCSGCHWGQPRRYRQDYSEIAREGESVPIFGGVGSDKRLYHSPCGDRFEEIPPHEQAIRLRLV